MPVSPGTDCNDFFSFDCHNKICVTLMEVCDGVNDCGNMADEDVCGMYFLLSLLEIVKKMFLLQF